MEIEMGRMRKFYFTYGATGHQFEGGWTIVQGIELDELTARDLFVAMHGLKDGFLPCAGVYTQEQWERTSMFRTGTNMGHGLWETIEIDQRIYREA